MGFSGRSFDRIDQRLQRRNGGWSLVYLGASRGSKVFKDSCASCHGTKAQGAFNWRKSLEDGTYQPPPLNGTGHAWHHPFEMLMGTINQGGAPMGGQMPAMGDDLSPHTHRLASR
ncbi:MAG: c-type cytochrome [Marinobacter sp.]